MLQSLRYNTADSLTHIGNSAFSECVNLTAITLPSILIGIGDSAFEESGIRNVVSHSPNFTFSDGCLIDQQNHMLLAYLSDKEQVSLPDNLTHIGNRTFYRCFHLIDIILPNSLTHIGDGAFDGCENLTTITMSTSLAHIGNSAFFGCYKLTHIILPATLIHIGINAFARCINLTAITLHDSLIHIGYDAFWMCSRLSLIFIPVGKRTHFEELLPEELHDKLIEVNNSISVEN